MLSGFYEGFRVWRWVRCAGIFVLKGKSESIGTRRNRAIVFIYALNFVVDCGPLKVRSPSCGVHATTLWASLLLAYVRVLAP